MTEKFKESCRNLTLDLDFEEIRLTPCGSDHSESFSGPGYVKQDQNGQLIFKLYSSSPNHNVNKIFSELAETVPGKLVPEHQYHSFEGKEANGRIWKCEKLRIDTNFLKDSFFTSSGKLPKLETRHSITVDNENLPAQSHQVWVPKKIKLPANLMSSVQKYAGAEIFQKSISRDSAKFKSSNFELLIFNDDDWLVIRIHSLKQDLDIDLEQVVISGLQYILSESLEWVMHERRIRNDYTFTLLPFPEKKNPSRNFHPLTFDSPEENVWNIFAHFCDYLIEERSSDLNLLTKVTSNCISASKESFDSFSLSFALGVEELLNAGFKDEIEVEQVQDSQLDLVRSTVNELEVDEKLKKRIDGLLSVIRKTDATDMLRTLLKKGVITQNEFKSWRALRAHFVHPKGKKLDTQKLVDKTYSTITLLHKLIFLKIGYSGLYRDYGENGWPIKKFNCEGDR